MNKRKSNFQLRRSKRIKLQETNEDNDIIDDDENYEYSSDEEIKEEFISDEDIDIDIDSDSDEDSNEDDDIKSVYPLRTSKSEKDESNNNDDDENEENDENEEKDDEFEETINIFRNELKIIEQTISEYKDDKKFLESPEYKILSDRQDQLNELIMFDGVVRKVKKIYEDSNKQIDILEKLGNKDLEIKNIETNTINEMEKIFNSVETKTDIVNNFKHKMFLLLKPSSLRKDQKLIRNSLSLEENKELQDSSLKKLRDDFYICYKLYKLPDRWEDLPDRFKLLQNIEDIKLIENNYNELRSSFISDYITLQDILELKIDIEDRKKLVDLYVTMIYYKREDMVAYFIPAKDELLSKYKLFKEKNYSQETDNNRKLLKSELITKDGEIEEKIFNLNIDISYKKYIYNSFLRMTNMSKNNSDRGKLLEWIETVINLPFNTFINFPTTFDKNRYEVLKNIKDQLDSKIYGLNNIKEEILMIINSKISNPYTTDNSFCLEGPAGVGKTKLINILANVLNYPFYQISVGGLNDVAILEGHSYTYIGSRPGKIVDGLKRMKVNNGIFYFDEIDKISNSLYGSEVSNSLLHITDFTQNNKYYDKYIGDIPIDLSKIWFIYSANNINKIDPILLNRMKRIIKIPDYTKKDKIEIVKKLLPDMYNNIKLNINDVIFTDHIIEFIIENVHQEKGMRIILSTIENILKRIKLLIDIKNDNKDTLKLSFYVNIKQLPYIVSIYDINILINDMKPKHEYLSMYI